MLNPIKIALDNETYHINTKNISWDEALKYTASLLEDKGFVTPHYVEKIIEDSTLLNFYYVVGPNIAMPHARPEFGALDIGLAVTVWPQGISFSNHEFNPVNVIFMISVLENDEHIDFIMKMAEILQNRTFINDLIACKTQADMTLAFQNFLQKITV
ncbi:MAG: PTS sugar transporter subunit IIA [Brevinema sp.]